jgi:hypothetical protein
MIRLNMNREPGCWSRLYAQAKLAHSLTKDEPSTNLRNAVMLMHAEQRAEGIAAGVLMCDDDDCPHAATHSWTRSAADLKGMRRKYKGTWLIGQPSSIRCERHVPGWLTIHYRPLFRAEALAA